MKEYRGTKGIYFHKNVEYDGNHYGFDIRANTLQGDDISKWIGSAQSSTVARITKAESEANAMLFAGSKKLLDASLKLHALKKRNFIRRLFAWREWKKAWKEQEQALKNILDYED